MAKNESVRESAHKPSAVFYPKEKPKKKVFNVSERQYLAAQKKAYKIWLELMIKEPIWAFDYNLNNNNYVALAKNPKPNAYTVSHETDLNSATGMFRFPNVALADKFIRRMGKSIMHLFPKVTID